MIEEIILPDDAELMTYDAPAPPDNAGLTPLTPPDIADKKPRGRPRMAIPETPKQRVERLKAELEKANQAHRAAELHLASIIGAVVIHHARSDDNFRKQLSGLLRDKIKNKADLAAVAEFLA